MSILAPTRHAQVEGRNVWVFDGLVSVEETGRYFRAISQAAFTRSEVARGDAPDTRHWVCEMPIENLSNTSLWRATDAAIQAVRPGIPLRAYRAYTNFSSFGDLLLTHVDSAPGATELTALWFLCDRWDTEWGGETLFYDASGDAQLAVSPRPARLLLFDGAIRHAGKSPNRNCPIGRYTFAVKIRRD
jgi:SM-20-related protein